MNIILGILFIFHAWVHLIYAGQSQRLFELRPGMTWPNDSWLFSKFLSDTTVRLLASILLLLTALGFVVGGVGLFVGQDWWHPVTVIAAVFSSTIYILFWDGKFQEMDSKGGIGLLINLAILVVILVLKLPA